MIRLIKKVKRNFASIFIFILILIISYLYYDDYIVSNLYIGLIGTLITLYFGVMKTSIENDRLFKDLFNGFNEKYDGKMNDLINIIKYDIEYELNYKTEVPLIIDYFNLSAEEYLWYSKNRIPKSVWKAWKSGIEENLEIPQIKKIFLQEINS